MIRFIGRVWSTLIALVFVASIALNFGVLAFGSIAATASLIFEAVTGMGSSLSTLREEIKAKDARIASLTSEIADLKNPKVTYRGQKHLIKDAVSDTADRVSKRTAVAATRNASSIVAESIPYLGIAAIIGVTAWDIKDSCETMKDLHELDLAFNPEQPLDGAATEVCGIELPKVDDVWGLVKSSATDYWYQAGTYVPNLPSFEWPTLSRFSFWK